MYIFVLYFAFDKLEFKFWQTYLYVGSLQAMLYFDLLLYKCWEADGQIDGQFHRNIHCRWRYREVTCLSHGLVNVMVLYIVNGDVRETENIILSMRLLWFAVRIPAFRSQLSYRFFKKWNLNLLHCVCLLQYHSNILQENKRSKHIWSI